MVSNTSEKVAAIEKTNKNIKLLNKSKSILNHCINMFQKQINGMGENILPFEEFQKKGDNKLSYRRFY